MEWKVGTYLLSLSLSLSSYGSLYLSGVSLLTFAEMDKKQNYVLIGTLGIINAAVRLPPTSLSACF